MLEPALMRGALSRSLALAASTRLTPFALLWLAAAVLAGYRDPAVDGGWLAAPLALLAVNLGAALLVDPRLRLRAPLLVFHVALLAVLGLAAAGELLRLSGRVELVQGTLLDPDNIVVEAAGPAHRREWLARLDVFAERFTVGYHPGLLPDRTRAVVQVPDLDGRARPVEIGNTQPLIQHGYRFHTTANKGFAALLTWRDGTGTASGALHFPSFPLTDWKQLRAWSTPRGHSLELELVPAFRVPGGRDWVLDSERAAENAVVLVRDAEGALLGRLRPGDALAIGDAELRLDDIRMWLGYRVSHDPLLPWLLACGLVGAAALGLHFWQRLAPSASTSSVRISAGGASARV